MHRPLVKASVVIPCFNEEGTLDSLSSRLEKALRAAPNLSFILVDNGSTDSTRLGLAAIADRLPRTFLVCVDENLGYGNGIKAGLQVAEGQILGWTHADLQTDPMDVVTALEDWPDHENACIKGYRRGRPPLDRFVSFLMGIFESALFGRRLWEINAQPTLFSGALLNDVLAGPDDFGLDLHMLVCAQMRGFHQKRIPVSFSKRFAGESSWNSSLRKRWRFVWRTLLYSFELRQRIKSDGHY